MSLCMAECGERAQGAPARRESVRIQELEVGSVDARGETGNCTWRVLCWRWRMASTKMRVPRRNRSRTGDPGSPRMSMATTSRPSRYTFVPSTSKRICSQRVSSRRHGLQLGPGSGTRMARVMVCPHSNQGHPRESASDLSLRSGTQ